MAKPRINIHVTPEAGALLTRAVAGGAASKAAIVDAALKQFLDAKTDERVLTRMAERLDKLTRAMERMADEGIAQSETLALFVLYYLSVTPPVPESSRAGAELVGRKRFEHFTREVGARLAGKARYSDALLAAIDLVRPGADDNDNEERAA